MKIVWKAVMFLLAVCHASLALLAFNFRMGVYDNVLKAGDKWSAAQLGKLALSKQMSAVVSRMGDVIADDSVAQLLYNERMHQMDASDVRAAILAEASYGTTVKKNKLADFARKYNRAASCATEDTAGWGGIDECTARCGSFRSSVLRKAPHEETCRMLCAVAVQPCTSSALEQILMLPVKRIKGNLSWASWAKIRSIKMQEMLVTVVRTTSASLKANLAGGKRVVTAHVHDGDWGSLLTLLLPVLLAVNIAMDAFDLSSLRSRGRRAVKNYASMRRQERWMTTHRVCRSRPKKCSEQAVYSRRGVSRWLFRGIVKAKADAVRKRTAKLA